LRDPPDVRVSSIAAINESSTLHIAHVQHDLLFDVTHIPRLPAPGQQKLYRRRVRLIIEEMRIFDGRIPHQAKVHPRPRHADPAALSLCTICCQATPAYRGERSGGRAKPTTLRDARVRYCCQSPPRCKLAVYGLQLSFCAANRYPRTGPHLQGICSASSLDQTRG
jgi:hypothetical protein